jgi:4-amino-4-deoxychorismate lyase
VTAAGGTWVDGVPAQQLPLPDRGLDFGDGLFETLLLNGGRAVLPSLHFDRLARGFTALGLPDCRDKLKTQLDAILSSLAPDTGAGWAALRMTITRGSGPRGYAPPVDATVRSIVTITPLDRDCRQLMPPAGLVTSPLQLTHQPLLAGIKHLNRLEQVLAAADYRQQGADEALLCNQAGLPVSVCAGNLFAYIDGSLVTPPAALCGVAGTRRRALLQSWAPDLGIAVAERQLSLAELRDAEEVFYTNSLYGLRPVGRLDERQWLSHPVAAALFQRYVQELR